PSEPVAQPQHQRLADQAGPGPALGRGRRHSPGRWLPVPRVGLEETATAGESLPSHPHAAPGCRADPAAAAPAAPGEEPAPALPGLAAPAHLGKAPGHRYPAGPGRLPAPRRRPAPRPGQFATGPVAPGNRPAPGPVL